MGCVVNDPHLPDEAEAETYLGPSAKRSRKSAEAKPSQHISTTLGTKTTHSSLSHSSSHSSSLLLDMDRHQGNPINSREQRSASHGTVDKDGWISIDTTQKSRDDDDDNKEESEGGLFVVAPTIECHIHFVVDLEQSRAGGSKQKEHPQASQSNIRDKR